MRVVFSGPLATSAGGVATCLYLTAKGLRDLDVDARVVTPDPTHQVLCGDAVPWESAGRPRLGKLAYLPHFRQACEKCRPADVIHAQGVWQHSTYAAAALARSWRVPYLITPHGMLYPQDIAKSNAWLKRLSLRLRLLSDLDGAAAVHATCDEERRHCRELGVTAPICVVPNPMELPPLPARPADGRRRIAYLGRLSPRKNVEGLLRAFAELGERRAELLIIGGGDEAYERRLRDEAHRLGLDNARFAGFLNGQDRERALASANVLAMPSEFENFGMVVGEGLARGIPCIATQGAPWQELQTERCGWWVPYTQHDITAAVEQALRAPDEQLRDMGQRGRQLIERRYAVDKVARQLLEVYQWTLDGGTPPACVDIM